jgi:multidrug efflux pump subunit AcrA (membrane-fusion protein)
MFGRAMFRVGERSLLAIPANAVRERGQLQSVFVVDNGVARARLITVGERTNDRVEVLSGLNPGDQVVFPVPQDLSDGARAGIRP